MKDAGQKSKKYRREFMRNNTGCRALKLKDLTGNPYYFSKNYV